MKTLLITAEVEGANDPKGKHQTIDRLSAGRRLIYVNIVHLLRERE